MFSSFFTFFTRASPFPITNNHLLPFRSLLSIFHSPSLLVIMTLRLRQTVFSHALPFKYPKHCSSHYDLILLTLPVMKNPSPQGPPAATLRCTETRSVIATTSRLQFAVSFDTISSKHPKPRASHSKHIFLILPVIKAPSSSMVLYLHHRPTQTLFSSKFQV